jgi:putative ABC transport system ATP-binding protein
MNILEARGLWRSFIVGNSKVDVLTEVNVDIEYATFNILMGPSGSGKTTLLNLLGVLDLPDKGKVL